MGAGRSSIARLKSVVSLSSVPRNTLQNSEKGPGAKNGKINSPERMSEEKRATFSNVKRRAENKKDKKEKEIIIVKVKPHSCLFYMVLGK